MCMHLPGFTCDNCRPLTFYPVPNTPNTTWLTPTPSVPGPTPTITPIVPGPFKCPDCGAWWVGYQHMCYPISTSNGTSR